jgi:hypothetical protein
MRAGLDVVEGDLDQELRPDAHDMAVVADGQRLELLRLPGKHLVGHALEGLAEHDEAAARRIVGAEVEVAQPAAPAPVAPFGGEDDEIERVRALYERQGGEG